MEYDSDYAGFCGNFKLHSEHCYDYTTPYFKVERCQADDFFVQRLDEPDSRKYKKSIENADVVLVLSDNGLCKHMFHILRKMSVAANHFDYYHTNIIAAANFVHLTYTRDSVDCVFSIAEMVNQLNKLWSDIIKKFGKKSCSFDHLCDCVAVLTTDNKQYFALIEPEVDKMVMTYNLYLKDDIELKENDYEFPLRGLPYPKQGSSSIVEDIEHAISKMGFPPSLTVDNYTRLLIMLADGPPLECVFFLQSRLLSEVIETNALMMLSDSELRDTGWEIEDIPTLLESLVFSLIQPVVTKLREQLLEVTRLLFEFDKSDSILIHPDVFKVVEVAELRRRALGNRFINISHFLWAFYECGYGLPPNTRDTLPLSFEDKSPPYHIYVTAIQLAASFEEKRMELEHFVFAVMYSKAIADNEVTEMQKRFRDFMKEVALDSLKRPLVTPRQDLSPDFEKVFSEVVFAGRKAI